MRSSRANPPIGKSVMSFVAIPNRRAAKACPNSCRTTQANRARMKTTPDTTMSRLLLADHWLNATHPSSSGNVA